jgi:hypothetical protein
MIDENDTQDTGNSVDTDRDSEAAPSTDSSPDEGVRLSNRLKRDNGKRINDDLRMIIYRDWKAGTRHLTTLARKYNMSFSTVKRLVLKGNPNRAWCSFEAQLALEHATLKSAEAIASEKIAGVVLTEWERARKNNLAVVGGIKEALWSSVKKLVEEMKTGVDFARIEYTKEGAAIRIPMSGTEAMANARTAAQAADLLVKIESLLYDKPTERKTVKVEDPWKQLTPDQMEEFARTGDLPAGVDVEQLFPKN